MNVSKNKKEITFAENNPMDTSTEYVKQFEDEWLKL